MFAVVYLNDIKKYIIVVEEWLFDVDEESLKNNGNISGRNVHVFWSSIGVDENGIPDKKYEPKFHLPIANVFPPLSVKVYRGK